MSLAFGGNAQVKSDPIWIIAGRSNKRVHRFRRWYFSWVWVLIKAPIWGFDYPIRFLSISLRIFHFKTISLIKVSIYAAIFLV